jgi:hypothetical protein
MPVYIVNVQGDKKDLAENRGFNKVYYSEKTNVTAIEVEATSKKAAGEKVRSLKCFNVLFIFE